MLDLYDEEIYTQLCEYVEDILHAEPLAPCVYIIEYPNKVVYIGSTFNIITRYPDLMNRQNLKILQSIPKQISRQTLKRREQFYMDEYEKNGYTLLNKYKAIK